MKIFEIISEDIRLGRSGRDYANTLIAYLRSVGITDVQIQYKGKHPSIVFPYLGRQVAFSFPSTGSDHRGMKNAIRDLKHKMMQVQQWVTQQPV